MNSLGGSGRNQNPCGAGEKSLSNEKIEEFYEAVFNFSLGNLMLVLEGLLYGRNGFECLQRGIDFFDSLNSECPTLNCFGENNSDFGLLSLETEFIFSGNGFISMASLSNFVISSFSLSLRLSGCI